MIAYHRLTTKKRAIYFPWLVEFFFYEKLREDFNSESASEVNKDKPFIEIYTLLDWIDSWKRNEFYIVDDDDLTEEELLMIEKELLGYKEE